MDENVARDESGLENGEAEGVFSAWLGPPLIDQLVGVLPLDVTRLTD
jgi:hypothetical protein